MVSRILKRAAESAEKRADDNEATIRNRIDTFLKNTDEILVQYPNQTRRVSQSSKWVESLYQKTRFEQILFCFQINGERAVVEIFADVEAAIDGLLAGKKAQAVA